MTLPNILYPKTKITIPSTKKTYEFRPFLVKEEKILLMAKESQDGSDILISIKQIVENCCLDDKFDIKKLAIFDLEYVFLKLRSISVDNICTLSYIDKEDKKQYDVKINLDDVNVVFPEKIDNIIKINDTMALEMRYPSASLYDDEDFLKKEKEHLFELIIRCVDKIFDGDQVYETKNYSIEEITKFVESLDNKTFIQIKKFLETLPSLKHETSYFNSEGHERKITLASLSDFFTLR